MDFKITLLYCFFMMFSSAVIVETDTVKQKKVYENIERNEFKIDEKTRYLNKEIIALQDTINKLKP